MYPLTYLNEYLSVYKQYFNNNKNKDIDFVKNFSYK